MLLEAQLSEPVAHVAHGPRGRDGHRQEPGSCASLQRGRPVRGSAVSRRCKYKPSAFNFQANNIVGVLFCCSKFQNKILRGV